MYGEQVIYVADAGHHGQRTVPFLHLLGISVLCMAIGYMGSQVALKQNTNLISPSAARSTIVGAAIASVAVGAQVPALATEQIIAPLPQQGVALPHAAASFAKVAEAPPVVSQSEEEVDLVQIGVLALFIPILGYASWTFGARKAKEDIEEAKEKYSKDLKGDKLLKVSPSGMATVKGFAMASDAGWKIQADELRERGIQGITGEDLTKLQKSGVTIVDVRPRDRYEKAYIPGSINVPLFQPITGWSLFKIARRVQFAVFGVSGTEYNTDFMKEYEEKVGSNTSELVFVDDSVRGTLVGTSAFPDGKPGHALMAIYLTSTAGYKNSMKYVEGGFGSYARAGGNVVEPN